MTAENERESTAWWGTCDDCLTTLVIYPHPEREEDVPHPDKWERFWPDCPVCDASMSWEGSDPTWVIFRNVRKPDGSLT